MRGGALAKERAASESSGRRSTEGLLCECQSVGKCNIEERVLCKAVLGNMPL